MTDDRRTVTITKTDADRYTQIFYEDDIQELLDALDAYGPEIRTVTIEVTDGFQDELPDQFQVDE